MSVAWQLYAELGAHNLSYQINSTGDPKCRPGYVKALVDYYQQHLSDICEDESPATGAQSIARSGLQGSVCQPIIEGAPHFLDYLCDDCAAHFATLRSYLDALGRPYSLNHRLVRGLDYYTKTVFEVWAKASARRMQSPAAGATMGWWKCSRAANAWRRFRHRSRAGHSDAEGAGHAGAGSAAAPGLCVYLGQQARLEALRLTSSLRAAGVPVAESFGSKGCLRSSRTPIASALPLP